MIWRRPTLPSDFDLRTSFLLGEHVYSHKSMTFWIHAADTWVVLRGHSVNEHDMWDFTAKICAALYFAEVILKYSRGQWIVGLTAGNLLLATRSKPVLTREGNKLRLMYARWQSVASVTTSPISVSSKGEYADVGQVYSIFTSLPKVITTEELGHRTKLYWPERMYLKALRGIGVIADTISQTQITETTSTEYKGQSVEQGNLGKVCFPLMVIEG